MDGGSERLVGSVVAELVAAGELAGARVLALEDPRHVGAERLGQRDQHAKVQRQLNPIIGRHANHSGFSRATTRYTSNPNATIPPST